MDLRFQVPFTNPPTRAPTVLGAWNSPLCHLENTFVINHVCVWDFQTEPPISLERLQCACLTVGAVGYTGEV